MIDRYEGVSRGTDERGDYLALWWRGKRRPPARFPASGWARTMLVVLPERRPWWNPFATRRVTYAVYRPPVEAEPAPAPPPEPEPMPAMTSNVFVHATGLVYVAPCREHSVVLCLPASGVVSQTSTADAR